MMRFFFSSSPSSSLSSLSSSSLSSSSSFCVIKSRESEKHVFKVVFAFLNFSIPPPSQNSCLFFMDGGVMVVGNFKNQTKTFSKMPNEKLHFRLLLALFCASKRNNLKQRWREEDHQPEGARQPFPPLSRHFP